MNAASALVTGGDRGMGAAICKRLAQDGFDVALTHAHNEARALMTKAAIEALGRRALVLRTDRHFGVQYRGLSLWSD